MKPNAGFVTGNSTTAAHSIQFYSYC